MSAGRVRRQSQELHREISEQRTAHEKRVEVLTEALLLALNVQHTAEQRE